MTALSLPLTGERRRLPAWGWTLLGITAATGLWWIFTAAAGQHSAFWAALSPMRAVTALGALADRGVLLGDSWASLRRLFGGLALAVLLGLLLGLITGASRLFEWSSGGVFQFLRMISPLSWAPIAVSVFGLGDAPVVFLVAAAAVWPVYANTVAGIKALDGSLVQVARSLGANRREVLRRVILPGIRGHVLTGIRLALGIGWVVLVPAEMLGVTSGLGYQILNARDRLAYDELMAVILVIGLLGVLLDLLSRKVLASRG